MDLNIRGRTALITGASKGIGLASAESLAAEGVNVILVSRTQADLENAAKKIKDRHQVRVADDALENVHGTPTSPSTRRKTCCALL